MREPRELINPPRIRESEKITEMAASHPHVYDVEVETDTGSEVHLREYWLPVRMHLWLIIGIVAVVTLAVALYMVRKPDIYEAQASVQVDLESTTVIGGSNGSIVAGNASNDPAYFNTQLQILTRPGLLRRVVKTLDLESNSTFLRSQPEPNRSTSVAPAPSDEDRARAESSEDPAEVERLAPYVEALQRGLTVEPVKETRLTTEETRLIDIRFSHRDPQIAAKVVNTIADDLVRSNLEKRTETSTNAGDFLQKRVAEMQIQIRNGEERLINYARNNQILSLDPSQNTVVERLAGLNRQLLEAENERKLAEAAYRAALAPGAANALAEGTAKQVADIEAKLADLRQRRAQLLVENTEEWPEVKEVEQQIAVLEKQVHDDRSRATNTVLTNLETRYRQAWAREQTLRAAFNQQRGETLAQNEAAINYRIIQQEIDTNKSLLGQLLQRSKENDVLLSWTPNNIHVVDYATVPRSPVGPKRTRAVALAFILSLAFGIGMANVLEYLNTTIRSIDDVEKSLRLPVLALIPSIKSLSRRRLLPAVGALQRRNGDVNQGLLFNADVPPPLVEAYRRLRTSLLMSMEGRMMKTLLVTASQPAEGKTTTALNLAMVLAQTGASVLVLDADMRRPTLHTTFGLENDHGLSNLLVDEKSDLEIFGAIFEHGQVDNLYLCPSGPPPSNPAELLGSDQMRRLIATLEASFTYIIIDSPPLATFTDAALISTTVDGVLLVIHEGRSRREVVRRSCKELQNIGARILGVVLNNVNIRSGNYYWDYYPNS